jgi:RHS repeat-associated protein
MFKLRHEHLEAFRPLIRARFPLRLEAEFRAQGIPVQREASTGDLLLADQRGYKTRIAFRQDGLPAEVRSPLGVAHRLEYDERGRLSARAWPGGERLEFSRDEDGKLRELRRPGILLYRLDHDQEGRLTRVEYPDKTETHLQYEETVEGNRIVKVFDRCGVPTEYITSPNGHLCSISDPLGRTIRFERTTEDKLRAIHYPDGSVERFAYDSTLRLGMATSRDDRIVLRAFDERGRSTGAFWNDNSSFELKYESDRIGTAINSTGTVRRERAEGTVRETSVHGLVTCQSLDPDGRLLRLEISDQEAIEYEYDADGRIAVVRDWQRRENHFSWSSIGTIKEIRFANGLTERREDARVGRLLTSEVIDRRGRRLGRQVYEYDLCERITGYVDQWGDLSNERTSRSLAYDPEGRILEEVDRDSRRRLASFEYDAKGNLVRSDQVISRFGLMDEPVLHGGQSIRYDAIGNMVELPSEKGVLRCKFLFDGSLQEALVGSRSIRFNYDAFGRRVTKIDGQVTWRYGWVDHQLLWEEQELPAGEIIRRDYLWLPGGVAPIAFRENDHTYWLQADARGAIIRAFDEDGKTVWRAVYDSFGRLWSHVGQIRQPWRLAGHYYDEETDLHYNLKRYYSPLLRSYLSRDPRWFQIGATPYSYARNDPWNYVDPFGTIPLLLAAGAFLLAAAVVTVIAAAIDSGAKKAASALERQAELGDPLCLICSAWEGVQEGGLWGLEQIGGVFVGAYEGLSDMVTGLGGMVEGAWDLTFGWYFDPESAQDTWENLKGSMEAIWDNPTVLWEAITQPIIEDWQAGRYGEAIGRGLFEVGSVVLGTKGIDKAGKLSRLRILGRGVPGEGANLLRGTRYSDKVRQQMRPHPRTGLPDNHGFPLEVDNFAGEGTVRQIIGGDGVARNKIELRGSYKGRDGTFEWIVEPDGSVNHRLFVPD